MTPECGWCGNNDPTCDSYSFVWACALHYDCVLRALETDPDDVRLQAVAREWRLIGLALDEGG